MNSQPSWKRRAFLETAAVAAAGVALSGLSSAGRGAPGASGAVTLEDLPKGGAPKPVPCPHFPDRLHALVWRNWSLVPLERLAAVVGAKEADILRLGRSMGLPDPQKITRDQQRRSCLTVIKHNWHLLPYGQLLTLLQWTPAQMDYTLREDDFFFQKLGYHKPACEPLAYAPPDPRTQERAREIARLVKEAFPGGLNFEGEPLFHFVRQLSQAPPAPAPRPAAHAFSPRFCYSYFALYGDPLLEPDLDPYPDGYLARLAASGADGVWLQAVLYKLALFPWDPKLSAGHEERLKNLRKLVARARQHGLGVWLYLNEPRAMPLKFYEEHPDLKGVVEKEHAALCTSQPDVQRFLTDAVASICRAVPDLAGFFSITASENLTNCWSHQKGAQCPRCGQRSPAEVIAEVNGLFQRGIQTAGPAARPRLIVWDWAWKDEWAADAINALPPEAAFMSVSEWSLPIDRGGVTSAVGEYSISAVGPGPRASQHWELARQRGLKTIAKIQASNTWELSAVPYIPAVENVARHVANLRAAQVDGLMLGWTLGGWPSPNLEVAAELSASRALTPEEAMRRVAERRFGRAAAPAVVQAWHQYSAAFSEFPFAQVVLYYSPLQLGPANLLWAEPTGYGATMLGFAYDDLNHWPAHYPPDIFIQQMEKVAAGFHQAHDDLVQATGWDAAAMGKHHPLSNEQANLLEELNVGAAARIHFQSVANQARFVTARRKLKESRNLEARRGLLAELERLLEAEQELAMALAVLQSRDSRIGFEASNQYFYVPLDLVEKVINCRYLRDRWLSQQA